MSSNRMSQISKQFTAHLLDKTNDPILELGDDGISRVNAIAIMKVTDASLDEANFFLELLHEGMKDGWAKPDNIQVFDFNGNT